MEFQQSTLPSGIRVVTEPMPSVRSVALGFWVGIGSRDEGDGEWGCSHFLEHLLFKGTSRRSAQDIAEALDAVGGEMNAFTSKEFTCFYARVLDDDLALAVDVLADMMGDATNAAADVEAERQVVLEEINIHLDSPDDLVHSEFADVLLGRHPLAAETLGSIDSITGMDRDTIHGYFTHHYRPGNVTVAAAGNVDHDALVALLGDHVGDLGRPGRSDVERTRPAVVGAGSTQVRRRPTEQAHVVLGGAGVPYPDQRRHALRVVNTLLGGGMSSRLFQEIRERRGLAYTTYSYATSFTDAGIYGAYAGTTPSRVDEVLKVMREQLDSFADTVTADEVERAKGTLTGGMVLNLEDTGSRMTRLGKLSSTNAPLITIDEAIARIQAVDLDAVRAVARDLLGAARALAVVGPFDADEAERFRPFVAA